MMTMSRRLASRAPMTRTGLTPPSSSPRRRRGTRCSGTCSSATASRGRCSGLTAERGLVTPDDGMHRSFYRVFLGEKNFVTCMRETLADTWPELAIGLGGVFNIGEGRAKFHVMPDFSPCPINTNEVTQLLNHSSRTHLVTLRMSTSGSSSTRSPPRSPSSRCSSPATQTWTSGWSTATAGGWTASKEVGDRLSGHCHIIDHCQVTITMTPPRRLSSTLASIAWPRLSTGT